MSGTPRSIYNSRNYGLSLDIEAMSDREFIYNSRNYGLSLDPIECLSNTKIDHSMWFCKRFIDISKIV